MDDPREEMEKSLQEMEERAGKVGEHVDETRKEWERKQSDSAVPGAEPVAGDWEGEGPAANEAGQ